MWLEFHTAQVADAAEAFRELGFRTDTLDLAEFGEAVRLLDGDRPIGAVLEHSAPGDLDGLIPVRSVASMDRALDGRTPRVGPVVMPGGSRALLDDDGAWVGLWEGGPSDGVEVRRVGPGWAVVRAIDPPDGWEASGDVFRHSTGLCFARG